MCDKTFDLLVVYDQIIVPKGLKMLPLEKHKKRGLCPFHGFGARSTERGKTKVC